MRESAGAVLDPVIGDGHTDSGSPPSLRDDGPPDPREPRFDPPVSNARIAMLAFILFESMLFAGLLGGFVLLRWGSAVWPPAGQPYLPIAVTWVNTAVLLGSCIPLYRARRGVPGRGDTHRAPRAVSLERGGSLSRAPSRRQETDRKPRHDRVDGGAAPVRALALTTSLGSLFLLIQGFEWVRLLAHGLTVQKGVYGGSFLLLIGTHGAHVLGAVLWLGVLTALAASGKLRPGSSSLDLAGLYWTFVCVVWIVLFGIVYLA